MPSITFESGQLTTEIKLELMQQLTDVSSRITGIGIDFFQVSIRELPDENIAVGGKTLKQIKFELGN
ncbi:MAG: tautomerase family protein [Bermanella sp.]